jgi:hypothetical protein
MHYTDAHISLQINLGTFRVINLLLEHPVVSALIRYQISVKPDTVFLNNLWNL